MLQWHRQAVTGHRTGKWWPSAVYYPPSKPTKGLPGSNCHSLTFHISGGHPELNLTRFGASINNNKCICESFSRNVYCKNVPHIYFQGGLCFPDRWYNAAINGQLKNHQYALNNISGMELFSAWKTRSFVLNNAAFFTVRRHQLKWQL